MFGASGLVSIPCDLGGIYWRTAYGVLSRFRPSGMPTEIGVGLHSAQDPPLFVSEALDLWMLVSRNIVEAN